MKLKNWIKDETKVIVYKQSRATLETFYGKPFFRCRDARGCPLNRPRWILCSVFNRNLRLMRTWRDILENSWNVEAKIIILTRVVDGNIGHAMALLFRNLCKGCSTNQPSPPNYYFLFFRNTIGSNWIQNGLWMVRYRVSNEMASASCLTVRSN